MTEYDISRAFRRIEEELIRSIMQNLDRHRAQEEAEGLNWEMWQVEQLKALEKYRHDNANKFDDEFAEINRQVEELFHEAEARGLDEADTLRDIINGEYTNAHGVNEGRVNALIQATTNDLKKAEHAVLRRANDQYRKIIFNAQTYAQQGGTYEEAVDMATRDFLQQGIKSIVYRNGARHNISEYASMAIRTGSKRAYLMGFGKKMNELGIHTVRVNKRTGACPFCARWIGKVLVDDVYSGGTQQEADEKGLPTLSEAMAEGFLHPNCKDIYSIYIEGVSKPEKAPTKKELQRMVDVYNDEQAERRAKDKARSYGRVAKYSMTDKQKEHYRQLEDKWRDEYSAEENLDGVTYDEAMRASLDMLERKGFSLPQANGIVDALFNLSDRDRNQWLDMVAMCNYEFDAKRGQAYYAPWQRIVHLNPTSTVDTIIHETTHRTDLNWTLEGELDGIEKEVKPSTLANCMIDPREVYDELVDYFGYETSRQGRIISKAESWNPWDASQDLDKIMAKNRLYDHNNDAYLEWKRRVVDEYGMEVYLTLADIHAGITSNAIGLKMHPSSYWKRRPFLTTDVDQIWRLDMSSSAMMEILAEYTPIKVLYPKALEELKRMSPSLFEVLEGIYEDLMEL